MKYSKDWKRVADTNYRHTASTKYESDGFVVWKGKYRVFSCIYSANEWHLQRIADGKILHSGKTAKECKGALEYAIKAGRDVHTIESTNIWSGVKFDEEFRPIF